MEFMAYDIEMTVTDTRGVKWSLHWIVERLNWKINVHRERGGLLEDGLLEWESQYSDEGLIGDGCFLDVFEAQDELVKVLNRLILERVEPLASDCKLHFVDGSKFRLINGLSGDFIIERSTSEAQKALPDVDVYDPKSLKLILEWMLHQRISQGLMDDDRP